MKEIIESIRRVMRRDSLIFLLVGVDEDGEVKIYQGIAKTNVAPPYIVMNVVPGDTPVGVYGDDYVIERLQVQVTAWARNSKEAWQLADAIQDALTRGDYEAEPWSLMKVQRAIFPNEIPDRDTSLVQVPSQYQFQFGKGASVW